MKIEHVAMYVNELEAARDYCLIIFSFVGGGVSALYRNLISESKPVGCTNITSSILDVNR